MWKPRRARRSFRGQGCSKSESGAPVAAPTPDPYAEPITADKPKGKQEEED